MILQKELVFRGRRDSEKTLSALFDSGASYSCINPHHVEDDFSPLIELPEPYELETAQESNFMKVTHVVRLEFMLNDLRMSDEFLVLPNLSEDVLIGAYTMQKWKIKLDFENDEIITNPKAARLMLK